MPHHTEIIGLASFVLMGAILEELENINPGTKDRIFTKAKAAVQRDATPNESAILAVLNDMA